MVRTVKDPETRRQEIVVTASQLFQSKSYKHTSMNDVMDALGIAKGTIYHYFKSKEELLAAVIESIVADDLAQKRLLLAQTPGNAVDKLRILITSTNLATEYGFVLEGLRQTDNVGMHTRLVAAAFAGQSPLYAELIQQGCAEGLFHTEQPLECAEFILAGVLFLMDVVIYPWPAADLQRRALALPALVETQLRATESSFAFLSQILIS